MTLNGHVSTWLISDTLSDHTVTEVDGDLSQIFAGGVVVVAGFGFNLVSSFLTRTIAARHLGETGFGLLSQGLAVLALTVLALFGLDQALGQLIPKTSSPGERASIITTAYQSAILGSFLLGVSFLISAPTVATRLFGDRLMEPILVIAAVAFPVRTFVFLTIGVTRGLEDPVSKVLIRNVSLPGSRLVLVLLAVLAGGGPELVAFAVLLSLLVAASVSGYYLVSRLDFSLLQSTESQRRRVLGFSAPITVVAASNMLYTNVDTIMLGFYTTSSDVGIYSGAFTLARLFVPALVAFSFLTMPVVTRRIDHGERVGRLYSDVATLIAVTAYPLFLTLVVFPETVLGLAFGGGYPAGAAALQVLALGFASHALSGPNESTLVALGDTRGIMFDSLVALVLNLGVNLTLIPSLGGLGAAVGTATAFVTLNVLFLRRLNAHETVELASRRSLTVVGIAVCGVAVTAALKPLVPFGETVVFLLLVPVSTLVTVVCWYGFGLLDRELRLLTELVAEQTGLDPSSLFR